MGLFERIFKQKEQVKRSESSYSIDRVAFAQLKQLTEAFGKGQTNVDLKKAVEKVSIVQSAIRVIADNISKCEIQVVQSDGKSTVELTNHPLSDLLKYQPSTLYSAKNWTSLLTTCLNVHGNAFYVIENGSFDFIDAGLIDKATIKDGKIFYQSTKDKSINYRQDEVLHFKLNGNGDSVFGLSPLKAVQTQVNYFDKSQKTIDTVYSQGINSKVYLDPIGDRMTTTEKQDELIEKIQSENAGYNNSGIMVTPFGFNLKTFTIPREDQAILLSSSFSEESICSAFFVPYQLIKPNPSVAVSLEQLRMYLNSNLINFMEIIEAELNNKLITIADRKQGIQIKFNKSKLYVNDLALLAVPLNTMVVSGIISRNEARNMLGFDHSPLPMMNSFTAQIQNADVEMLSNENHPLLKNVDNKLKSDNQENI